MPTFAAREFSDAIVAFYEREKRDLPWRHRNDGYAVWVSEIMLQQTRVAAAVPFFERWMARFPTIEALAAADLDDVLAAWSGLGYYSRARNLHRGASEVVAVYGGRLPSEAAALARLPGIGPYTAGAIASIAFGCPAPLVDGNVARVLARIYAIEGDIKSAAVTKTLWAAAAALVPESAPGAFNQGLMELGATVCVPRRPRCSRCPVESFCAARAAGREGELPERREGRRAADKALLATEAAWLVRRGRLLLARRPARGLYGGLWELPQAERPDALGGALGLTASTSPRPLCEHRQELSHRRLHIRVWRLTARGRARLPSASDYEQLAWHSRDSLAFLGLLQRNSLDSRAPQGRRHMAADKETALRLFEEGYEKILDGLDALGYSPRDDENFHGTARRAARGLGELILDRREVAAEVEDMITKTFPAKYRDMVISKHNVAFGVCPHHVLPVIYRISLAYIPTEKVLGISKLSRLAKILARSPMLQEDLTHELSRILHEDLASLGSAAYVEGLHMCMASRGTGAHEARVVTSAMRGIFLSELATRGEFIKLVTAAHPALL